MSEARPLPADMDDWPQSPFELLGATPTTDAVALKRAYQRLIRFYRPEQYPEEFRRIREAYETASSFARMLEQSDAEPVVTSDREDLRPEPDDGSDVPPGNRGPFSSGDDDASVDDEGLPPSFSGKYGDYVDPSDFGPRLTAAWRLARESNLEEAYAQLRTLKADYPRRPAPYMGLYWLLRLNGRLDPDRNPCDELEECLRAIPGGCIAVVDLYRRELERVPDEAVSERSTRLLREVLAEDSVYRVVQLRWQAASRRGLWQLIQGDLDALRKSKISYDREAWLRCLWSAAEACLWAEGGYGFSIYAACLQEMEQATDAALAQQGILAYFDYFVEVTKQVRKLRSRNVPQAFGRIVAESWSTSHADLYLQVCAFFGPWVENPEPLLRMLTDVRTDGSAVLGRLEEVLQSIGRDIGRRDASFWTPETALPVAADFAANTPWRNFDLSFRTDLLRFCLYQRLTPSEFAEAINRAPTYSAGDRRLAELVAGDLALRCAFEALRLFDA
jgi:hypothetical protein